ncbi:hypothetical protein MMA231_01550 [Asticcacaulis sp. MM231]|uniref:hypothetical protein n=1 Tax=Asticcacaulis sp. MM231 TaxID=3157666 RepID=UPI0032D56E1F
MKYFICVTAVLAALSCVGTVGATTFFPAEMKCPVGGKTFKYQAIGSNSYWGSRPDGRPYSPMPVTPMPECPDNYLVVYREFTPEEIGNLKTLLQSPGYLALMDRPQVYRAAWLEKSLKPQSESYPWMVLQAAWTESNGSPARAGYLREFAQIAATTPVKIEKMDSIVLQMRAANAWRELGDFDTAASTLDALPLDALAKGLPDDPELIKKLNEEAGTRWNMLDYIKRLRVVISRKDSSAEPLDMIPPREAASQCFFTAETLTDFGKAFCQSEDIKKEIEESRQYWEPQKAEMDKAAKR